MDTSPPLPSGNRGGRDHCPSGGSVTVSCPSRLSYAVASLVVSSAWNAVSCMPSGASTRSRMTSSNGAPPARAASTPSTWEPAEYSHRSPGWASSGSSPSRAIQVSGSGVVSGFGGPNEASSSSSTAVTIGHGSGS